MIKHLLVAAGATFLVTAAIADNTEANIKKTIETALGEGAKVDNVRKAGALNLYEVQLGGNILYTDEKANYFLVGHLIDGKSHKDLTQERLDKLSQIKFSDLPLDLAIKQVKGNGKRVIATFEDPNCGYCKKLAQELQSMNNITVYTFLVPVFGGAESNEKNRAIWCAPDRVKAWNDAMLSGTIPAAGKCDTTGLDKSLALAQKLNIRGTPAMFFADGSRSPGYMPAARLEEAMKRAAEAPQKND